MLNVNGTPCPFKWRFPSQKMSMKHSRPLVSGNTQNSGSWRYCSWWKKIGCTRPCICDICDATSVTYDVPPRRCIVLECWSVKTVGHKLLEAEEHVIAWKKYSRTFVEIDWTNECTFCGYIRAYVFSHVHPQTCVANASRQTRRPGNQTSSERGGVNCEAKMTPVWHSVSHFM